MEIKEEKVFAVKDIERLKNKYLTTLKLDDNKNYTASVEFDNYQSLLHTVNSLISVCQTTLITFADNERNDITPYERGKILMSNNWDVINTLQVAKQLLPYSEAEFLDEISNMGN